MYYCKRCTVRARPDEGLRRLGVPVLGGGVERGDRAALLLGLPADQPVELLTGGRDGAVVAEGEIGRKGNRMAVRINRRTALLR